MSGCQKRVFEKNVHFLFLSFLCWRKKKRKHEKTGKQKKNKKKQKNSVFVVVVNKNGPFYKNVIFRKIGKYYLCSEGQKRCAFSLQLSVLGKWSFFWCPFKVTKHYKNRGFSRHGGKPKMALLVAKVPFWVFPRKGVLLSVIHRCCALLKTLFL